MLLDARDMDYTALNDALRLTADARIKNCLGQRFLGAGMSDKHIVIDGVPGNALGAYLNGAEITVYGNAQDAVGDTMNDGKIIIHGNVGMLRAMPCVADGSSSGATRATAPAST